MAGAGGMAGGEGGMGGAGGEGGMGGAGGEGGIGGAGGEGGMGGAGGMAGAGGATPECTVDGDCVDGVCVDDACVDCRGDLDCAGDEICDDANECIRHVLAFVEVNGDPVQLREFLMVTVTVSNPGPNIETVDVDVFLPQGINPIPVANRSDGNTCSGNCDGGDVLSWRVANLAPGKSEVLWLRPQIVTNAANAPNQLVFTADVSTTAGFQIQPQPSTATGVNDARALNLRVEENANPVGPGEELTYTITFANQGVDPLDNVDLTFNVPDGTSHASGGTVTWALGRLSPGAGGTREVTVTLDDAVDLPLGSQLRAVTEIANPDETTRATTQTQVSETPLSASVAVNLDPAQRVEFLMVSVTVANPSQSVKTAGVKVHLPQGINPIPLANRPADSTCSGNCDGGDALSWTVADLAASDSEIFVLRPQVVTNEANAPDGMLMQYEAEVRPVDDVPLWTSDTTRVFGP